MGRLASAAGWAGFGGAAWVAGQAIEAKAFLRAAGTMNRQVANDYDAIGVSGQLPPVTPVLPLHGGLVASKPRIFAKCLGGGCLVTFAAGFIIALPVLLAHPGSTASATVQALFGAVVTGVFAAMLLGWLFGIGLWIIYGSKENARRSANVVLQRYREYWQARERARYDLAHGADPDAVRQFLGSFEIATHDDEVLFGGVTA